MHIHCTCCTYIAANVILHTCNGNYHKLNVNWYERVNPGRMETPRNYIDLSLTLIIMLLKSLNTPKLKIPFQAKTEFNRSIQFFIFISQDSKINFILAFPTHNWWKVRCISLTSAHRSQTISRPNCMILSRIWSWLNKFSCCLFHWCWNNLCLTLKYPITD